MDLRRSVLLKQRSALGDASLNISNLSAYDSAVEESDSSVYYSFIDDSIKSVDVSMKDESEVTNCSNVSEDKENTVIMRSSDAKNVVNWALKQSKDLDKSDDNLLNVESKSNDRENADEEAVVSAVQIIVQEASPVVQEVVFEAPEALELQEKEPTTTALTQEAETRDDYSSNKAQKQETSEELKPLMMVETNEDVAGRSDPEMPSSSINILIQDPNENLINPFTAPVELPKSLMIGEAMKVPSATDAPSILSIDKRVTRSSLSGKLPTKTHLYLPVLRKSLDRKPKAAQKPANLRRTIAPAPSKAGPAKKITLPRRTIWDAPGTKAGTSSNASVKPRQTFCDVATQAIPSRVSKVKTPTQIPKPIDKSKSYKCSVDGCSSEFTTLRALREHQNEHKITIAAAPSFTCKWCDKKFQVETALLNHQTEKCSRIPFNEKRKILAQRDKKEVDRRRTTLFTVPLPRRKSPMRRPAANASLNKSKSGIKVTPKKSLKCHICHLVVPDALTFANHVIWHKSGKDNSTA